MSSQLLRLESEKNVEEKKNVETFVSTFTSVCLRVYAFKYTCTHVSVFGWNGFTNKERFNERIPFLVKRPRNEANSISEGNKSTVFLVHFLANVSVLFTSRYRRAATKIDSISEIEVLNARQNPKANAHVRYEIS